ncbi:radical SAM protein [Papillibacter cinnamivorans]|uniref:Radical SAM superfamily enzyme, MoaA/NifB/PqqE/SkfB family n=1 Tax=Papillibacter cinnamivorans DSM 12816 TaxID=1122930 RepID=A0A1W2CCW9_9FIRM|nr:radical SAM protein [Papillibacter cinnamivorans]SMC82999.1 Radical SAM superfamily enzyme, MoaA/NifB/PqqE/SkfB family [Papillibacter cinnamivorans DSM 12816]
MRLPNGVTKFAIQEAVDYITKNPDKNLPKLIGWVDKFSKGEFPDQRKTVRAVIEDPNHPYHNYLMYLLHDIDKDCLKTFFVNFILNASLIGWRRQDYYRDKYNCNVPWAILLDPTSACNLHCTGCWAAEYGNKLNLSFEEIDNIITQGKELGVYFYIYTGGEPLVRKKDLIAICNKHPDCEFLSFTNGTLIDEEFANDMLRVKNFIPAISIEGFEEATDGRRGQGTYQKVIRAMELLKSKRLPFGISCCYTRANMDSITSEEFYDKMIEMGALFVWYFHYMPVGNDASVDLLPTEEQRKEIIRRIRDYRDRKPIFAMDFQNDAEYVEGCIAGGRRYLHINANGDVDPCVFIHYSDSNIREKTLLEALTSPLFMAYHDGQPFNDNMLRPCPMLENPEKLRGMVSKTGAKSTDLQSPESAEHLCAKCDAYAACWAAAAEELWEGSPNQERFLAKQERLGKETEARLAGKNAAVR